MLACPVCGSNAERGRDSDYGERQQYRCPRCGPFVITGTAIAMLKNRLRDPRSVARVSHAIRTATSEDQKFLVDSTNVDELANRPLPSIERQSDNLINWMKEQVGERHLSSHELPPSDVLASIVGAADGEAAEHLLQWAAERKLMVYKGDSAHLTPSALQDRNIVAVKEKAPVKEESKVEKGHCPNCGPSRNANVVAEYDDKLDDERSGVWAVDTYQILKCAGCDTVYVKKSHIFSEDMDYEHNSDTGEFEPYYPPRVTYWPAPATRARPTWIDRIDDKILNDLLGEVYSALDGDEKVLAAIGARAVLDRAMVLKGAREADDFGTKLTALQALGMIGQDERDILSTLTDAGGAAVHRGWSPSPEELSTIFDGMEAFLHRALILGKAVQKVKAAVPPRSRRKDNEA